MRTCWCVGLGLGLGLGLESGFRAHVLVRGEAERQRMDLVVACSRHQVLRKGPAARAELGGRRAAECRAAGRGWARVGCGCG